MVGASALLDGWLGSAWAAPRRRLPSAPSKASAR